MGLPSPLVLCGSTQTGNMLLNERCTLPIVCHSVPSQLVVVLTSVSALFTDLPVDLPGLFRLDVMYAPHVSMIVANSYHLFAHFAHKSAAIRCRIRHWPRLAAD